MSYADFIKEEVEAHERWTGHVWTQHPHFPHIVYCRVCCRTLRGKDEPCRREPELVAASIRELASGKVGR